MPKQLTFASSAYAAKKARTKREMFVDAMNAVVPWARLVALIDPVLIEEWSAQRPPLGLGRVLRVHFMQLVTLSDPAIEELSTISNGWAR